MAINPRTRSPGKEAAAESRAGSSSGAAPLLESSPPMFTSSSTSCTTPMAAARLWMHSISSALSTEWISSTAPTTFFTLFF